MDKRGTQQETTGNIIKGVIFLIVLLILFFAIYFWGGTVLDWGRNLIGFDNKQPRVLQDQIIRWDGGNGLYYYDGNQWQEVKNDGVIDYDDKQISKTDILSDFNMVGLAKSESLKIQRLSDAVNCQLDDGRALDSHLYLDIEKEDGNNVYDASIIYVPDLVLQPGEYLRQSGYVNIYENGVLNLERDYDVIGTDGSKKGNSVRGHELYRFFTTGQDLWYTRITYTEDFAIFTTDKMGDANQRIKNSIKFDSLVCNAIENYKGKMVLGGGAASGRMRLLFLGNVGQRDGCTASSDFYCIDFSQKGGGNSYYKIDINGEGSSWYEPCSDGLTAKDKRCLADIKGKLIHWKNGAFDPKKPIQLSYAPLDDAGKIIQVDGAPRKDKAWYCIDLRASREIPGSYIVHMDKPVEEGTVCTGEDGK